MKPFVLPEPKLNALAQSISQQMIEQHPFEGEYLLGDALKDFSEQPQINKFLIFQVFQVWEMQTSKLRHPFFDVDHGEVQASLKSLQNVLSRHIRIARDDFQPMLQRAVYNHLKLLLDPVASFSSFFFLNRDSIPRSLYQRYVPYFPDYKVIVNSILKYHEKYEKETIDKSGFFQVLAKVLSLYNQRSDKSFEAYRKERFEALTGRSFEAVKAEADKEQRAEAEAKAREEVEARKRQAAEQQEAEAATRAKAEAERREAEEAKRKAEEEAKLKAEAEARRKREEEAKKASFFDTVAADEEEVALDFEEDLLPADANEPTDESPVAAETEPVHPPQPQEIPIEEEPTAEKAEAPEPEVTPETVTPEPKPEPVAEKKPEPVAEPEPKPEPEPEPEAKAEPEPEKKTEPASPEPPADEKEFEEMAANLEPKTGTPSDSGKESTTSFLNRFLANKQEKAEDKPTVNQREAQKTGEEDKSPSILDKLNERSQEEELTQKPSLVESLNGNRKIKLDEIPIHKQYQFVQKVFEGNNVRFRIIVDKVNNAKNKEEVEDILDKFVLNNDDLNKEDKVVTEFIALLRNRY